MTHGKLVRLEREVPPDAPEAEALSPAALLRLLQLTSPALPIGAFAFSQGLEMAVELGHITDEPSALAFLLGTLGDGFARVDLPVLARLHAAWTNDDEPAVLALTQLLLASRETHERRLEDAQLGRALARLLSDHGVTGASVWVTRDEVTHATLFALAAVRAAVPLAAALHGFAFTWAESQVGALSRLVPLGQLAAQRVLTAVANAIPAEVRAARALPDTAIGATLPGLAIASALHETQYTRLFKS